MKSPVVKRSIVVAGHKTSVSLEEAFWNGMKEISGTRDMTLSELVGEIDLRASAGVEALSAAWDTPCWRAIAAIAASPASAAPIRGVVASELGGSASPFADRMSPLSSRLTTSSPPTTGTPSCSCWNRTDERPREAGSDAVTRSSWAWSRMPKASP